MADKNGMKDLNLIGTGTTVDGKIRTQGSIRIDGKLTGEVHAAENLAVGTSGEIDGGVNGKNVTIGGKVKGNITAADKLVLEGKSSVRGDVRAARLVIDEGAQFDGRVSMTETRQPGQSY